MSMHKLWILLTPLTACVLLSYVSRHQSGQPGYFPNRVGDHWVYRYSGQAGGIPTHIYVDITGVIRLPDGRQATLWVYTLPDRVLTEYIVSDKQEVRIYEGSGEKHPKPLTEMPRLKNTYLIPMVRDLSWVPNPDHGDTLKVIAGSKTRVKAGNFENTWTIINCPDKSVFVGNSKRVDTIWFTPHVGMVKKSQLDIEMRAAPGNGLWELESYHLR